MPRRTEIRAENLCPSAAVLHEPLPARRRCLLSGCFRARENFLYSLKGGLRPPARRRLRLPRGFRDHHQELHAAGAAAVFGLSSQDTDYQAEAAQRLGLPFALLSDPGLMLADRLGLPTFTVGGQHLYRRITLVVSESRIEHVFYP